MTGFLPSKTSPNTSFMVSISDMFRIRIAMLSCGGLVHITSPRVRLSSFFAKESSATKIIKGRSKSKRLCIYFLVSGWVSNG